MKMNTDNVIHNIMASHLFFSASYSIMQIVSKQLYNIKHEKKIDVAKL